MATSASQLDSTLSEKEKSLLILFLQRRPIYAEMLGAKAATTVWLLVYILLLWPNVIKFYLVIPNTISIQMYLFPSSTDNPVIFYKFKFVETTWKTVALTMFTRVVVTS